MPSDALLPALSDKASALIYPSPSPSWVMHSLQPLFMLCACYRPGAKGCYSQDDILFPGGREEMGEEGSKGGMARKAWSESFQDLRC